MNQKLDLSKKAQNTLKTLFKDHGCADYRWFYPEPIVMVQCARSILNSPHKEKEENDERD